MSETEITPQNPELDQDEIFAPKKQKNVQNYKYGSSLRLNEDDYPELMGDNSGSQNDITLRLFSPVKKPVSRL